MNIVDILKEKKQVFVVDDVENKKMKFLIESVNENLSDMAEAIDSFNEYKNSQLKGNVHTRIVMVKSLLETYPEWQAVITANQNIANEEKVKENEFYDQKNKLINSLKSLLNETQKSPAVCLYDLYNDDYQLCDEGHEIIILGNHNSVIIEHMIDVFEDALKVKGLFEEIGSVELQANYVAVNQNADLCYNKIEIGTVKASKIDKIKQVIEEMVEIGRKIVVFATYKKCLLDVGVKEKEIQNVEKSYIKQYVPIKKYLQKELGVSFADVCDVVVNEDAFAVFGEK